MILVLHCCLLSSSRNRSKPSKVSLKYPAVRSSTLSCRWHECFVEWVRTFIRALRTLLLELEQVAIHWRLLSRRLGPLIDRFSRLKELYGEIRTFRTSPIKCLVHPRCLEGQISRRPVLGVYSRGGRASLWIWKYPRCPLLGQYRRSPKSQRRLQRHPMHPRRRSQSRLITTSPSCPRKLGLEV